MKVNGYEIKPGADLSGADLYGANLMGANLYGVNLRGANLYGANLYGVNLYGANLRGADLRGVNLYGVNLYGVNLYGVNLYDANLSGANLYGVNLSGADLRHADLRHAKGAELAIARTRIIPDEGEVIGWKKCRDNVLVKLLVPATAKRSHAFGRKCRASKAKVLEIVGADEAHSLHDNEFIYRVGKMVSVEDFDEDWKNECAPGIHFYITRLEAENHN
jgi:hypothetical protein